MRPFIKKITSCGGVTTRQKRRDIGHCLQLSNSVLLTFCFSERGFWQEISKSLPPKNHKEDVGQFN